MRCCPDLRIEHGAADVDCRDNSGLRALHLAAEQGHVNTCPLLSFTLASNGFHSEVLTQHVLHVAKLRPFLVAVWCRTRRRERLGSWFRNPALFSLAVLCYTRAIVILCHVAMS